MSFTKITVRYGETDAMGVVHHANYYLYFEVAREDLIKELGISYKELEESGVMLPLVETQCKYIEAAKYDDNLVVEATISQLTPVKVKVAYVIRREEDNKILAKGNTLQAFVDRKTFKIINLKNFNKELWDNLMSNYQC
ncbi:acyl-CoA thioester hydrolase, YbgC/YbaW family protein [Clostridium argentinense CDC 2741]|uniref:Acyl-CoA thioester hydrolase, YbgC/YbaW family protein n=1 Tax=Clostridium argentinense CDC 2741 TaxID=1418104 RepID=A0A0C1TVQ0_9CLOT|nr:thioesterase family protein [Clostridium argentinense]ARC84232.1 4-hydroxybenzoyl-CoA thioesterase [Clostridium argentinense]KIE44814.1 acyl-CoA thioester hydrolase, YbgC/YbaW family protein [Clostridium argentinense CDC 2741]NFF38188.1 acyl-CoA thioesterase [Clostridium argentinense]NFP49226.1 acyl-CoA thioesterase [Clostridium argentinense]NFP71494.1 acyl-CoA thioesterase [Clostridium argentinense]